MLVSVETLVGVLVAIVALVSVAERLHLPYPIVLVIGGLLLALIPALPALVLNPDLVLLLFLPPLVYSAAWFTSWRDFQAKLLSISFLAIGLVVATTLVVGVVAHAVGLPWVAAFVLGAIVSPTDTVAAGAIATRLGLPRRIMSVVEGESLVNDATGLIVYRFAVAAALTGTFSFGQAAMQFALAAVVGILCGLVVGLGGEFLHRHVPDTSTGIALSFLLPYVAYLGANALGASGVLAVATAGIYLGRREALFFTAEARLQAYSVWNILIFLLNSILFILLGFQLRPLLALNARLGVVHLVGAGLLIALVVIVVRLLWVFPGAWLAWKLGQLFGKREMSPKPNYITMVGWLGMRGVVSLAAALALPDTTLDRSEILVFTFAVILVTLLAQGLSVPAMARVLRISDDGKADVERVLARQAMARAGMQRLDALPNDADLDVGHLDHLRTHYSQRLAELTDQPQQEPAVSSAATQVKSSLLAAERAALIHLRDDGQISDEILHELERELDFAEVGARR